MLQCMRQACAKKNGKRAAEPRGVGIDRNRLEHRYGQQESIQHALTDWLAEQPGAADSNCRAASEDLHTVDLADFRDADEDARRDREIAIEFLEQIDERGQCRRDENGHNDDGQYAHERWVRECALDALGDGLFALHVCG